MQVMHPQFQWELICSGWYGSDKNKALPMWHSSWLCWFRSGSASLEEHSWERHSFPAPREVQCVFLLTVEGDPSESVVWRGRQTAEGKQSARKNSWLEFAALNLPMNMGCELQNDTLAPGKQNGYKAPIQLRFNGREDRSALWEKTQLLISILSGDGAQYSSFLPAKSGGSTMCFKVITAAHPRSGCISNEAGDAQVGSGCSQLNVEPAFRPADEMVLSKTNHHISFLNPSSLSPSGLPGPAAPPWMAGKARAARPNVAPWAGSAFLLGLSLFWVFLNWYLSDSLAKLANIWLCQPCIPLNIAVFGSVQYFHYW